MSRFTRKISTGIWSGEETEREGEGEGKRKEVVEEENKHEEKKEPQEKEEETPPEMSSAERTAIEARERRHRRQRFFERRAGGPLPASLFVTATAHRTRVAPRCDEEEHHPWSRSEADLDQPAANGVNHEQPTFDIDFSRPLHTPPLRDLPKWHPERRPDVSWVKRLYGTSPERLPSPISEGEPETKQPPLLSEPDKLLHQKEVFFLSGQICNAGRIRIIYVRPAPEDESSCPPAEEEPTHNNDNAVATPRTSQSCHCGHAPAVSKEATRTPQTEEKAQPCHAVAEDETTTPPSTALAPPRRRSRWKRFKQAVKRMFCLGKPQTAN